MARKPVESAAADQDDAPEMVSVTILAEGVRVDGAGNLPVGISVLVSRKKAESLKAEGLAE